MIIAPFPAGATDVGILFSELGGTIGVLIKNIQDVELFVDESANVNRNMDTWNKGWEGNKVTVNAAVDAFLAVEDFGEKYKVLTPIDQAALSKDELLMKELFGGFRRSDDILLESKIGIEDVRLKINSLISQLEQANGSNQMSRRDFGRLLILRAQVAALDKRVSLSLPQLFPKGLNISSIIAELDSASATDDVKPLKIKPAASADRKALTEALFGVERKALAPVTLEVAPSAPVHPPKTEVLVDSSLDRIRELNTEKRALTIELQKISPPVGSVVRKIPNAPKKPSSFKGILEFLKKL